MSAEEKNNLKNVEFNPKTLKLKELSLSGYTVNPLVDRGIITLGDVTKKTKAYYEKISYYRKSSLDELEETLKKYGLEFKENLALKPIEELDLSEKVYMYLKQRNKKIIDDVLQEGRKAFSGLDKREAAEILRKVRDFGIPQEEWDDMLGAFNDKQFMYIRIEQYGIENNADDIDIFFPLIAKEFMRVTASSIKANYSSLYSSKAFDVIGTMERREEEINNQTEKIRIFLDSYTKKLEKIILKIYKECVFYSSRKDRVLFVEAAKIRFENTIKAIEMAKKKFQDIIADMREYDGLTKKHIHMLVLYFPLVIESEVCHSLVPHTKYEKYITNDEHYKIIYKRLKKGIKMELDYIAKSKDNSTYEDRIKPVVKKNYGRSSSGYTIDSYDGSSFGERVRAEISGTAAFLSVFLRW